MPCVRFTYGLNAYNSVPHYECNWTVDSHSPSHNSEIRFNSCTCNWTCLANLDACWDSVLSRELKRMLSVESLTSDWAAMNCRCLHNALDLHQRQPEMWLNGESQATWHCSSEYRVLRTARDGCVYAPHIFADVGHCPMLRLITGRCIDVCCLEVGQIMTHFGHVQRSDRADRFIHAHFIDTAIIQYIWLWIGAKNWLEAFAFSCLHLFVFFRATVIYLHAPTRSAGIQNSQHQNVKNISFICVHVCVSFLRILRETAYVLFYQHICR